MSLIAWLVILFGFVVGALFGNGQQVDNPPVCDSGSGSGSGSAGSDGCLPIENQWTPVTVDGKQGVVVSEADAQDMAASMFWRDADSAWMPTVADLEPLEARIDAYAQTVKSISYQPIPASLDDYKRQYAGFIENGERKIGVNGFCNSAGIGNWRSEPVFVMDGGVCFFTAVYNADAGSFEEMHFNGDA
jgi:hypothetical protein